MKTQKLFRPDLREGFVVAIEHKGKRIEIYLVRKEFVVNNKTHIFVHAVSYTIGTDNENDGYVTYSNKGIVGFDSAHGWYDSLSDKEQYKHIASAMNQAMCYIDGKELKI